MGAGALAGLGLGALIAYKTKKLTAEQLKDTVREAYIQRQGGPKFRQMFRQEISSVTSLN